jgi:hypothetical protein
LQKVRERERSSIPTYVEYSEYSRFSLCPPSSSSRPKILEENGKQKVLNGAASQVLNGAGLIHPKNS